MVLATLIAVALAVPSVHAAETYQGLSFYLGDPHAHTGVSGDGGSSDLDDCTGECGAFVNVFEIARDNGLDWVGVSDHSNGSNSAESDQYAELHRRALAAHDPDGGFVVVPASEVWLASGNKNVGHVTLLMFGPNSVLSSLTMEDLAPPTNTGSTECTVVSEWMNDFTATWGKALPLPHHPAATMPMATVWGCHDDTYQPAVEVYSSHGNSLTDDDPYDPLWSTVAGTGLVSYAIDPDGLALRMGFIAGTDSHDTRPGDVCRKETQLDHHPSSGGLTIAVLDEGDQFGRSSLHEAILDRRTYATSGPLVPVSVTYHSGGAVLGSMGTELSLPAGQTLDIALSIPDEWHSAVVGVTLETPDGGYEMELGINDAWEVSLTADQVPAYVYPTVELDGLVVYGEDGCDDGGSDDAEWLWLSPSWIDEGPADLDGDGVAHLDGDCNDGDPNISPELEEIWYDGIDQDCDGNDDDQDGDGFGVDFDCDDTDPTAVPGGIEIWYDGIDQDCDGRDDDQDDDGVGIEFDCDDTNPYVSPDHTEIWYDGIDQDCDHRDDDQDRDGFGIVFDCDDLDPMLNPDAPDKPEDGIDQDCDGLDASYERKTEPLLVDTDWSPRGCAAAPIGAVGALPLLLLGLVRRRR